MSRIAPPAHVVRALAALVLAVVLAGDRAAAATAPGISAKKVRVGILHDPPYTYKDHDGRWIGLNADLWRQIAQELRWDFDFVEMKNADILKSLHAGSIDLSIITMYITPGRERAFDFTMPFGHSRVAVATVNPQDHPWIEAMLIFFSWGTLKVLVTLLCILVLAGFVFWLIERKDNVEHFGDGIVRGVGTGIYWVGSTLASGVCFGVPLKSLAGKIAGIIWMLVCALALSAFIASLTASLAARTRESTFVTPAQLKRMHLGTVRDDVAHGIVRTIGGRYDLFDDEKGVIDALLGKRIQGFLFDEVTLDYYAANEYHRRMFVKPTTLRNMPLAYALPKNSALRKPVNVALLSIMERPIWEAILSQYGLIDHTELTSRAPHKQKR